MLTCRLRAGRLALLSRSVCEGNSPPSPESVLTAESRGRGSCPGARSSTADMEAGRASEVSEEVTCSTGRGWPRGPSGGLDEVTGDGGEGGETSYQCLCEDNILFS